MYKLPFLSYLLEESITDIGHADIGKVDCLYNGLLNVFMAYFE